MCWTDGLKWKRRGKKTKPPALWWVDGAEEGLRWIFEELSRKAANVPSDACGMQQGDSYSHSARIPEQWLVKLACVRTGAVWIPGTQQLTAKGILHRLQKSEAKCVITDNSMAPTVDSVGAECQLLKFKLLGSKGHRRRMAELFKDLLNVKIQWVFYQWKYRICKSG
ncbi:acyl-coenzyme A synthetase ACSM3, mitochondrial-like isoform X1 [Falco biarmicus]|uniref:acyl-coenzyme A synthetase ACSM3, mitochondrial isoform X1 n=1 Tax=Falco cherrug TaxID=345164 RepID=UPI002479669E|nr:acyl-coenzyme A synthetase ACSM3, mitochondrial isoform X1 [Falco cherrug]XP_055565318.1 acyl-coenzyme A synthetase ACSM3, mitochondrial isoform X1 [Falco cherrug]XP_056193224.1 acyl-coenzyme A synthetase ACSM3, mitochondrial-like isoform X1 [Falco biarmicus]XP_056193225.1 acyl-coenzyme A synthetase ACSM3, mitochondrial-like isoform X1 [Falco biarmicus]